MAKTIKIGHASLGEGGLVSGGQPGDQTGKEVYIYERYDITNKGYHILLRPTTAELAEKSARACEAGCANPNIGYAQFGPPAGRMTLYNEAKKVDFDLSKITTGCNTDCSAFMSVCAIAGGANVQASSTTRYMKSTFTKNGDYKKFTDSIYFSSPDYLRRGDILVGEGIHTIMILANGSKVPATTVQIEETQDDLLWVDDFFAIKVAVNITNIDTTKISAEAKITKIENGKEKKLNSSAVSDTYKWTYELSSLTDSKIKVKSKKLDIDNKSTTFSLNDLSSNTSYILRVVAKEKEGEAEFSSPNVIFTTANKPKPLDKNLNMEFRGADVTAKECKLFLKIKDSFKRAIAYHK